VTARQVTARRIKLTLIVTVLVASALVLLAWTQTWVQARVAGEGGVARQLEVTGSQAAPALTALALAGLALAGALSIAGVVIRVVLGILEALLGVSVFLASLSAVTDPAAASASAVTAVTGITGTESVRASLVGTTLGGWPYLALAAACLMVLAGLGVVITARRWPGPTARYQAVRLAPASIHDAATSKADGRAYETGYATTDATESTGTPTDGTPRTANGDAPTDGAPGTANGDAVIDWDDLSRGDDPTA
jgi:uncharacterized membrane protein (TIGR02234 family)